MEKGFFLRLFEKLRLAKVLNKFKQQKFVSSSHYWEQRYSKSGTSGLGSYGVYAKFKADILNGFVSEKRIKKVVELGCGDGNQLQYFDFHEYLGVDVSSNAISLCRNKYQHEANKSFLVHEGEVTLELIRKFSPELVISLDVIFHLVEDSIFEEYVQNLFGLSRRYVIIYSTNFDKKYDSPHQIDRKFTVYIENNISGWILKKTIENPLKGNDTQSDFYIYEKCFIDT